MADQPSAFSTSLIPIGAACSSWLYSQDTASRSGRQRTKRVVPRNLPLRTASYFTSATNSQSSGVQSWDGLPPLQRDGAPGIRPPWWACGSIHSDQG